MIPVRVSRGVMHTHRDAASQSHTQPSPKMNWKLGCVGSCKASWAAARCSAGAQQTNTKYLISQELTQTERGRSGCSPLRSNPRLGREISSREDGEREPTAGSTALAREGELQVGKVLRAKQGRCVPLPVCPCTGF